MCKRCNELEQEIEGAEEHGFGFTTYQLREELNALEALHNAVSTPEPVAMTDEQIETCKTAVKLLRQTPYDHPYRAIRMIRASGIETQMLIGNDEHNEACVNYCMQIISAFNKSNSSMINLFCPTCGAGLSIAIGFTKNEGVVEDVVDSVVCPNSFDHISLEQQEELTQQARVKYKNEFTKQWKKEVGQMSGYYKAEWFCRKCCEATGEEIECYTIANTFEEPCINCGSIDKGASYILNSQYYLTLLKSLTKL